MQSVYSSLMTPTNEFSKNRQLVAAIASAGAIYVGYKVIKTYLRNRYLISLIEEKRRKRDEGIAQLRNHLNNGTNAQILAQRKEIVELGFDELRSRLQDGKLTAVDVLEAFQCKALDAHEKTNFACEFLLEANEWAENLDAKYKDLKKPPLFGIPISVKECHFITGHDSTGGFAQFLNQPVDKDHELVTVLKDLGAIPFVMTNIPTTMFSVGCSNPIYGDTTNPVNPERTCGGSSGGEGPVIALRGSPLGIGGDIGGSVRTPAHCCGICALKPTAGRLLGGSNIRVAASGITAVKPTMGPMGYDVDSLVWFMRTVCAQDSPMFQIDSHAIPMPFNDQLYAGTGQTLTIGYYDHDNWMTASPACRRAVQVARRVLESYGHHLIPVSLPFDIQEMRDLMEVYVAGIFPDGGTEMAQVLASDLVDPAHRRLANFVSCPIWYRKFKSYFTRSPYWRTVYSGCESNTASLRAKYSKIDEYKAKFYNEFWKRFGLDALICPVAATPALPIHVPPQLFGIYWSYCALYNLLNYSAGSVQCTHVTLDDERAALDGPSSKKGGLDDDDWVPNLLRKCQKGSTGLPVGIQVVALPFRDELCLRVMKEIETGLKRM